MAVQSTTRGNRSFDRTANRYQGARAAMTALDRLMQLPLEREPQRNYVVRPVLRGGLGLRLVVAEVVARADIDVAQRDGLLGQGPHGQHQGHGCGGQRRQHGAGDREGRPGA